MSDTVPVERGGRGRWRTGEPDEALLLLRSGRHSVSQVAVRVGYENESAFAFAFRHRFGRTPSSCRPKRPSRAAPR